MEEFLITSWRFDTDKVAKYEPSDDSIMPSTWYHCQRDASGLKEWLSQNGVSNAIIDSLLADDTRPRFEKYSEDCFLIILRGINFNQGAEPDDMLSLRILWYKGAVVSTRKVPSRAVTSLLNQLEQGQGPTTLQDLILAMVNRININISEFLVPVEEMLDSLSLDSDVELKSLNSVHTRLLRLKRYLKPQKYVLEDILAAHPKMMDNKQNELKNCLDMMARINESVEFYIDQIEVYLLNLNQQQAEKMNRNTYLFSVIAGIFLPAGFFTGLLGVNIGGIPGTESPFAFALFCVSLLAIVAVEVVILKKLRFI